MICLAWAQLAGLVAACLATGAALTVAVREWVGLWREWHERRARRTWTALDDELLADYWNRP